MKRSLERISIRGYKSIRDLDDLSLKKLNVFIGANGAGKTNFISLFALLNQLVQGNLQIAVARAGGANALLYFGQKSTSEIDIRLDFDHNSYRCRLVPVAGDTLVFAEESIGTRDRRHLNQQEISLGSGHKETLLPFEMMDHPKSPIVDGIIKTLLSFLIYHFQDTSESARVKQQGDIHNNLILNPDAGNLAAYLYLLRETKGAYYNKIVSTIRLVAPFFDDFSLRPNPLNPERIQLEWREKGSDAYFNAHMLSDGTLRFICLATLLLQPKLPSIIIIDEPELGLHPYAISLLASLLKGASQQAQVIVSTQSVPLVNQFEPDDIVVVDRKDGQSAFMRQDEKDLENWLDEYGMGDLWEKNVLGGRPG